jgi:RNA exonuclease 1
MLYMLRLHILYTDELVKPHNVVKDHLTQWSGVSAAHLATVTTRLCQVQAHLLRLVSRDDMLVGHSLENDLR